LEFTLNFVWALIAGTLLVIYSRTEGVSGRDRRFAFIAFLCVICALFPVISITDDLSNVPLMAEGSQARKWLVAGSDLNAVLGLPPVHAVTLSAIPGEVMAFVALRRPHEFSLPQASRRPPPQLL
jgi:hypothetical protein